MAMSIVLNDNAQTDNENKHLELFSLIWLDANINIKDSRDTEQKLRSIINHLIKFQDVAECQKYVEQKSKDDRLVLIVSGRMGREIVSSIYKLRQVVSVYVYCKDKKRHEKWVCKFVKVKAVVVDLDELISRIKADHNIQTKVEEPLSINMFSAGKLAIGVNGQFVFSRLLSDCLLRMKLNRTDINELISLFKSEYQNNTSELGHVREFEQNYSFDKALWWYTRQSFFYKTMNAALRMQNIHMIFLYRSFISDIHRQLQYHQMKYSVTVYRSQLMSSDELDTLKEYIGQFISVNSFLSATKRRSIALFFLGDTNQLVELERILFEIDADPSVVTTKPFADISSLSNFVDEEEVLFMLGSMFRLISIKYSDDEGIWIIQMKLCGDNEHDLKQVLLYMNNQIGSKETNLRTLGKVLWQMGKLDLAEKYYIRFLNELSSNDPSLTSLYDDLGQIASQKGEYDMSIKWYQELVNIKKQPLSTVSSNRAEASNSIESRELFQILQNAIWFQNGSTVAGGNGDGSEFNQLWNPQDLYVDDDQTLFVADSNNHRIVQYKFGATSGQVVAGGNGKGDQNNQLSHPTDVIVDKKRDCLIICNLGKGRVVQWPLKSGKTGETIIWNVPSYGLAMDDDGFLYIPDYKKHEVRRWRIGEVQGVIVAGGNGQGHHLDQLNKPLCVFVDRHYSVYVSDAQNHRVVKWIMGAKQGIVVAGGHGKGKASKQLDQPGGLMVDPLGNLYVADMGNNRIIRWSPGAKQGVIVVGGNGRGNEPNQFVCPVAMSLDCHGNLYVVDHWNHRVQRFSINMPQSF